MHVLLVEDSVRLRDSLTDGLQRSGYGIDAAADGEQALRYARHNDYDIIILDLMLPKVDGLTVLKELRAAEDPTHILILTARDSVDDRVEGLRLGADDYLTKPFAFEELVARLEALTRRSYRQKNPRITVGPLEIDTSARLVHCQGDELTMTRREYALLEYLAFRAGDIVSRRQIEDHLYGENNFPMSNAVDRLVCAIRRKLETVTDQKLLATRRGLGYMLQEPTS